MDGIEGNGRTMEQIQLELRSPCSYNLGIILLILNITVYAPGILEGLKFNSSMIYRLKQYNNALSNCGNFQLPTDL